MNSHLSPNGHAYFLEQVGKEPILKDGYYSFIMHLHIKIKENIHALLALKKKHDKKKAILNGGGKTIRIICGKNTKPTNRTVAVKVELS